MYPPYDSGSYASSTTYLTGIAVMKTCETLKEKILAKGAQYLECSREEVDFDGKKVFCLKDGREISLMEIGNRIMCNNEDALFASESYSSPVSPPRLWSAWQKWMWIRRREKLSW